MANMIVDASGCLSKLPCGIESVTGKSLWGLPYYDLITPKTLSLSAAPRSHQLTTTEDHHAFKAMAEQSGFQSIPGSPGDDAGGLFKHEQHFRGG